MMQTDFIITLLYYKKALKNKRNALMPSSKKYIKFHFELNFCLQKVNDCKKKK